MTNSVLDKIKEILVPKLGESVTDSALRVNCKRIGISPEEITKSQIPELVKNLKATLMLFFEDEEVKEVSQEIVSIK